VEKQRKISKLETHCLTPESKADYFQGIKDLD